MTHRPSPGDSQAATSRSNAKAVGPLPNKNAEESQTRTLLPLTALLPLRPGTSPEQAFQALPVDRNVLKDPAVARSMLPLPSGGCTQVRGMQTPPVGSAHARTDDWRRA